MPARGSVIDLGAVFTLLFIALGPFKVLGPFALMTKEADERRTREIALWAFAIAVVTVVVGGFVGRALLANWDVSPSTLLIAGGTIFFLVATSLVLEQYEPIRPAPPPLPAAPVAAAMRLTFPAVITPYGIAALIVMLANSTDGRRTAAIVAIAVGVMLLNLIAMLNARRVMTSGVALMALQVLGAVLGVLQLALAVEMILLGLRGIGVLSSSGVHP